MAIPKFDETMLPILQVLARGEILKSGELPDHILRAGFFTLTDEELSESTASGTNLFRGRVSWGKTFLKQGKFIYQPERGLVKITQKGLDLLATDPSHFLVEDIRQDPDFQSHEPKINRDSLKETKLERLSPQDLVDRGFNELVSTLKTSLLEKLHTINPYYFQRVILILFQKMGYGDFQETPKSGDGGIDGIIYQDQLGLEKIYIQAKRYETNKVREPEIRNFIGAMSGDVNRGIFVTTSSFDISAIKKAQDARNHKIVLIDGEKLAELMIKYNVGIQSKNVYETKEIDEDFFELE